MSVIRSGPLGVRVIPILLFAFLWYGICQTIKDAIVWGGIANAAELRGFWPDLMVATAGFFVASLILRAVIEDTEAEARERIEQELGEFRPLIEAEKSRRDLERLRNAIGQGFREGIMVPEEVIEDAYPGTFSKREKIGATTKRRIVEMVPYEEARPFSRGIGKYTKPEQETRTKSGRQDTGRQYIPRKPVTMGWARSANDPSRHCSRSILRHGHCWRGRTQAGASLHWDRTLREQCANCRGAVPSSSSPP